MIIPQLERYKNKGNIVSFPKGLKTKMKAKDVGQVKPYSRHKYGFSTAVELYLDISMVSVV